MIVSESSHIPFLSFVLLASDIFLPEGLMAIPLSLLPVTCRWVFAATVEPQLADFAIWKKPNKAWSG